MQRLLVLYVCCLFILSNGFAQSPSFKTFINPVIPGDHPDPTLTQIGNYFYTSGSSFNPTPKIFRSTDLVHWQVISQPVSSSWSVYGDEPGGGIWGGHMVFYQDIYWHFFGRGGGSMYFVTADQPEGPWSEPTLMQVPAGLTGLGVDNSIFIDDDGKWYMLTKNGQENNHIVELGDDGQPSGAILDLTWLNPNSEGNPYGWAEGPVMWKYNNHYYYSFAEHLVGKQYVMKADLLTDDQSAWTVIGTNIFTGSQGTYNRPNHISPVVMLKDGTSWTIVHSYHSSASWYAHGRQGLLCQVTYDENELPVIQYPPNDAVPAPALSSGGTPWMVPHSDMFTDIQLKPDWSFLGYTPDDTYSLTERSGWLLLEPYDGSNTVIQNDGEHSYALITRVDFEPESASDEAGLWIINGPETLAAKVFSTRDGEGEPSFALSFENTVYQVKNTIGTIAWLKLVKSDHTVTGYYSADGMYWSQIGEPINASKMDIQQTEFNNFTGNQQGLYIKEKAAFFDLYVYKDAYTSLSAESAANFFGVIRKYTKQGYVLDNIHNDDWAMFAGFEFGNTDYNKTVDSLKIIASCTSSGGNIEVWLDSLDTGEKIAVCPIQNTGNLNTFQVFSTGVTSISGNHDVYLKFTGSESEKLFQLQRVYFKAKGDTTTSVKNQSNPSLPKKFNLKQNYPNPFNPKTRIEFEIPEKSFVSLKVYNLLGEEISELAGREFQAGHHSVTFDAANLPSGIYFYKQKSKDFTQTKKMVVAK